MVSGKTITQILEYLCALLAAWFAGAYLFVAFNSINYPYQLEWVEGSVMDEVQHIVRGLPIYSKPTLAYTPHIYTPGYFYVTAAFTKIFGMQLLAGRMVSFLSTIAIAVILYVWVWKETANKILAFCSTGLFFSTYVIGGAWFHLARVDMLFMAVTLAGLLVFSQYQSVASAIAAGLIFTAGFLTKQQELMIAFPALIAGLAVFPLRAMVAGGVFFISSALLALLLEQASDGWFGVYAFLLPWNDQRFYEFFEGFLVNDMWYWFGPGIVASYVGMLWTLRRDWRKTILYSGIMVGMIGSSCASRIHIGGYLNVLIPAYVILSLMSILSIHYAADRWRLCQILCLCLVAAQMLQLWFNPLLLIPTEANYQAGKAQMDYIANIPGEVFIPDMQFVQTAVGKASYNFGWEGRGSLLAEANRKNFVEPGVMGELVASIKEKKFAAIMLKSDNEIPEKNGYYMFKEKSIDDESSYLLVGNPDYRPNLVFVPIPDDSKPW